MTDIDALLAEVRRLDEKEKALGLDPPPCSCGCRARDERCGHDCNEARWYYDLSVLRDEQNNRYRTACPALAAEVERLRGEIDKWVNLTRGLKRARDSWRRLYFASWSMAQDYQRNGQHGAKMLADAEAEVSRLRAEVAAERERREWAESLVFDRACCPDGDDVVCSQCRERREYRARYGKGGGE